MDACLPRRGTPAGIRTVDLVLSSACNLACSYCYQNDKKKGRMSWESARAALDLALDDWPDELDVHFLGGEPLLEMPTIRRAVEHVGSRRRADKRVQFYVGTNGMLLGEEELDFFAEHGFQVHLSFDGVPAAQRHRGAHTFEKLDALLDRLRARRPRFLRENVTVSLTFLPSTIPHLAEGIRYFLAKGLQEIDLSPQTTDSASWDPAGIEELDAAFRQIFDDSLRHRERTGETPVRVLRRRHAEPARRPERRSVCGVGRGEDLTVDVDGEAYGCVAFARSYQKFTPFLESRLEPMRLGSIHEGSLHARLERYPEAVRRAEIFDGLERKRSSYGRCIECRYFATCSFCPVSIGKQTGSTDPDRVPDLLCAFNLVHHAWQERFPALDEVRMPSEEDEPLFLRKIRIAAEQSRAAAADQP